MKLFKILLIVFCLITSSIISFATDGKDFIKEYKERSILLQDAIFVFNIKYHQGDKEYKVGNNFSVLFNELSKYPESKSIALEGIGKIKKSKFLIPITYLVSIALLSNNQILAGFGTFYFGAYSSQYLYISGKNSIQQAIWQYNQKILE